MIYMPFYCFAIIIVHQNFPENQPLQRRSTPFWATFRHLSHRPVPRRFPGGRHQGDRRPPKCRLPRRIRTVQTIRLTRGLGS